ncbi:MAG: DUF3995 domain-containing protein [Mycobacteriales bacterium]
MSTRDTGAGRAGPGPVRDRPVPAAPAWPAYAAAAWMAFFGLVHGYWAVGGGLALPAGFSVRDSAAFLVVDLVAIPLCAVGALLALALLRPAGRRLPRRPLLALAWATTALLVGHALPAMVVLAGLALGVVAGELTERDRLTLFLYEPYWLLGGVLFGLATLAAQRRGRAGRTG